MVDNPVIVTLLTVVWMPSVLGLVYLWALYARVRRLGNQWLLQLMCLIATPVTLAMVYVSWATYARITDNPPSQEVAAAAGLILVFMLAPVVPYTALRIYWSTRGEGPQPEIPVTNGKVKNGP